MWQKYIISLSLVICSVTSTLGVCYSALCGKSSSRVKRVVGGADVNSGDWPWQVSLQFVKQGPSGNVSYHFCGGSILNKYWIVTATHCGLKSSIRLIIIYDREGVKKVLVGINKIGSYYLWKYNTTVERHESDFDDENPFLQSFDIDRSVSHPPINPNNRLDGEIFLIKLSGPIQFNSHISPVCLPQQDQRAPVGMTCWTSGWGVLEETGQVSPETLQEVDLEIISKETCTKWYAKSDFKLPPNYFTENMVCAGYEHGGKSSCFGDSGGPLVCQINNRWTLFGIVSHGGYCGFPGNPGIYVYVPKFVDWIRRVITT